MQLKKILICSLFYCLGHSMVFSEIMDLKKDTVIVGGDEYFPPLNM